LRTVHPKSILLRRRRTRSAFVGVCACGCAFACLCVRFRGVSACVCACACACACVMCGVRRVSTRVVFCVRARAWYMSVMYMHVICVFGVCLCCCVRGRVCAATGALLSDTRTYMYAYAYTHTHAFMHAYTHARIHTYKHMHTMA
jgi:hypothetical protein